MARAGFTSLPDILWRKPTNAPNKFMGSGMLPAGAYVTYEHEYILIFRKGGKRAFDRPPRRRQLRRRSAYFWEERNVWFSDVWTDLTGDAPGSRRRETRARSAAFPFELPYRLIQMFSVYGDTVLDPFAGARARRSPRRSRRGATASASSGTRRSSRSIGGRAPGAPARSATRARPRGSRPIASSSRRAGGGPPARAREPDLRLPRGHVARRSSSSSWRTTGVEKAAVARSSASPRRPSGARRLSRLSSSRSDRARAPRGRRGTGRGGARVEDVAQRLGGALVRDRGEDAVDRGRGLGRRAAEREREVRRARGRARTRARRRPDRPRATFPTVGARGRRRAARRSRRGRRA